MNPSEPFTRPTILVVDDSPEQVALLVDLLKGLYRVKVATTGGKGIELATASQLPDLILLDVMLPDLDGFEVCKRLKADPETREIPVLFLTSKSETHDEARGFACGAADYITKPFSAALVLARVRTHLEQRRLLAAERSLLDETLKSALGVIIEMLSMSKASGPFMADGWDYYCTPRAQHPRSAKQFTLSSVDRCGSFEAFRFASLIAPRPLLVVIGGNAVTAANSMQAFEHAKEPREAFWVEGASHGDLYDKPDYVTPVVAKLADFFHSNLVAGTGVTELQKPFHAVSRVAVPIWR